MNGDDIQGVLADAAHLAGWWRAHFRPLRTTHGWRVPGTYESGDGWPDLILVRDTILAYEIKGDNDQIRDEQMEWLKRWRAAGAEVAVVTRHNLEPIVQRILERPRWGEPSASLIAGIEHLTPGGRVRARPA